MAVKRASLLLLALLLAMLAACGPSPQARAREFARYLPAEIGDWERQDRKTVELLSSTITSTGHVTYQYKGPDDALAYIVIEAHPSNDAAEVALASRERELRMMGLDVHTTQPPGLVARIAQGEHVRYALLANNTIMVEIDVLAADAETPVSDEAFEALLDHVRAVYNKLK